MMRSRGHVGFLAILLWAGAQVLLTTAYAQAPAGSPPEPTASALSSGLRLSPIRLEVTAPATASTLRISNDTGAPVVAQVRIFRWTLDQNGEEVLEFVPDVAVSPPIVNLQHGQEQLVRVVRTTSRPLVVEESYRVVVDQIPLSAPGSTGVGFRLRFILPAFFTPVNATASIDSWAVEPHILSVFNEETGQTENVSGYLVTARNAGTRRVLMSNLQLTEGGGVLLGERSGTIGYVLAGSTARWFVPASGGATVLAGQTVTIVADGDGVPLRSSATAVSSR